MKTDEFIDKLDTRLTKLEDAAAEMRVLQAQHNASLTEHMRRTEVAEENLALLRSEFAPLKTHVAIYGALAKIITVGGALAGLATGLSKLVAGS